MISDLIIQAGGAAKKAVDYILNQWDVDVKFTLKEKKYYNYRLAAREQV